MEIRRALSFVFHYLFIDCAIQYRGAFYWTSCYTFLLRYYVSAFACLLFRVLKEMMENGVRAGVSLCLS